MDQNRIVSNTSQLNKALVYLLSIFEKNKEWADISQWLSKVESALSEYPSPYIKDKIILAKRLAQCLNPLLLPAIHSTAINIYSLLFKNMKLVAGQNDEKYNQLFNEDIGMYAVGLFPFYQNASIRVKEQFLEVVKNYFVPLQREIIPCLPGLILCLLPGLEDNNEQLLKNLNKTLDMLFQASGRRYFLGSLWMAVMRQRRGRAAGIKLLQRYIPKSLDRNDLSDDSEDEEGVQKQQQQDNNQKEEILQQQQNSEDSQEQQENKSKQNQSPLKQQQQKYNIKPEFEVIEQNIDDDNDTNNFPNKSTLVINSIIKCLEDESALVKRTTLDFMIQYLNIEKDILSEKDKLVLIETQLYLLQKKDASMSKRVYTWLFGKPDMENRYKVLSERNMKNIGILRQAFKNIFDYVPTDQSNATVPIKILQNFYMEHEELVGVTLSEVSTSLIDYIYKYHEGYDFSQDIKKFGRRFLQSIPQQIDIFMNSLSQEVVLKIKQQDDEQCLMVVNLIKFTFEHILKLDHFSGITARNSVLQTISGIFKSLATLSQDEINQFQFIQPALNFVLQLVDKLENLSQQVHQESKDKMVVISHTQSNKKINQDLQDQDIQEFNFDNAVQDYSQFYEQLSLTLTENSSKSQVRLLKAASLILVKIQKFLSQKSDIKTLPNWFKCITTSIKMKNPRISLVAIEAMIEILISEKKDPIYETFKNLILEETQAKQKSDTLISGSDYTKVTLEKLWQLLDFQYYHEQIIDLILNFSKYFPQYFKEVVVNSFQNINIAEQESAIRRFASFWKLTQQNYQQKPLLIELNKVGLFIMLDFLDHDNPLLRNASKTWLIESSNQLYRIIDPLFEVLIQPNSNFYRTDYGQLIYTKQYETQKTTNTFRKLKSILVNSSDMFSKYISTRELAPAIAQIQQNFTTLEHSFLFTNSNNPQQPKSNSDFYLVTQDTQSANPDDVKLIKQQQQSNQGKPKKMTYLDLLVLICLKYIQGQALESLSTKFFLENAAVNASSCEFLEYLISHFEDPQLSMRLCQYILDPLLNVFHNCIINEDYVMQIQVLNLFRVIFFRSSFANRIKDSVQRQLIFTPVLSSKKFIPNILKGLNTEITYIQQQFINFITQCLPIICQNLPQQQLTTQIKSILYCYSNLIQKYSHVQLTSDDTNDKQRRNSLDVQYSRAKGKNSNSGNVQEDYEDDQQYSFEVSIILEGVADILDYFLKIKSVNKDESIMNLHLMKQGHGVMGSIGNALTFGVFSKSDQREKIEYNFDKYKETCECILYDIQKVLEMLIMSWNMSSSFQQIYKGFTSVGSQYYQFSKFNQFNQKLKHIIDQIIQKKSKNKVKIMIVNVFQSLLLQYPQLIMNTVIQLWNRECAKDIENVHSKFSQTLFMGNLTELLIISDVSTEFFLEAFNQSDYMYRTQMNYVKKHPKEKKNQFVLNIQYGLEEARLIYFLYIYLSHNLIDGQALKKDNLITFWMQILKILKIFGLSKNPSTSLWILEFIYMLSRKYSPKEILNDNSFKKALHDIITDKLNYLSNVASRNYMFIFNTDPKDVQIDKKSKKDQKNSISQQTVTLQKYQIIVPFSPTIYELALIYQQQNISQVHSNLGIESKLGKQLSEELSKSQVQQKQTLSNSQKLMFENIDTKKEEEIYSKYRLFILKSIKNIALDLLQNTYAPEKVDRIVSRTREYMEPLFQVIEDKTDKNALFLESSSEVLHYLIQKSPNLLIKEFKKGILDIFNKDNFFNQSKQTLKYWSKIIDQVVRCDKFSDQFGEYLSKITLTGSLFTKESTVTNTRVKSFKRVCFIIFSGEQDQYASKLQLLLDKISEVIKNAETVHPSLLILILFCIRILILRLSNNNLNELFKQIWPMIITLLIQIYNPQANENRPPNLLLAGLKLIEILSISQFDEFYLHQWIFIFDYFGLQVQPQKDAEQILEQQSKNTSSIQKKDKKIKMTPFHFQPYISNCMPNQEYLHYVNESYNDEQQITYKDRNRRIIMTQSKVEDVLQLKYSAWQLCLYLIECNEHRSKVQPKVIEDLIEDDFIQLDEDVLKV